MKKRSRNQSSRATGVTPGAAHKRGAASRLGKATISRGEPSLRPAAGECEPERPLEIGPDDHDDEGA